MDFSLPADIESLLGYDISRKPTPAPSERSPTPGAASLQNIPGRTTAASQPTVVPIRPQAVTQPSSAALAPAGRKDAQTRPRPCACVALHFECDPSRCPQAGSAAEPRWPLSVSVFDVQACAKDGCWLCGVLFGALYDPHIQSCWDLTGSYRNWPGKGLMLVVRNAHGHLHIKDSGFMLTRRDDDAAAQLPDHCNALSRLRAPVRLHATRDSIEDIKTWLGECQKHQECPALEPNPLPTRVLDLGPDPKKLEFKILCTDEGATGYYTTLSHCWGAGVYCKTTTANLAVRRRSIDAATMPRTFYEAALITQALGLRYLWIDALCIIQDDIGDWEKEAARMAAVYQGSSLTIAASGARDGSLGCFVEPDAQTGRFRDPDDPAKRSGALPAFLSHPSQSVGSQPRPVAPAVALRRPPRHNHLSHRLLISEGVDADDVTFREPLLLRAWTVQERLLSPRIAHFTATELLWECAATFRCQCGRLQDLASSGDIRPLRLPPLLPPAAPSPSPRRRQQQHRDLVRLWFRLVEMYSNRNLTFPSDRFPALSGLARAFRDRGMGAYLAGHWAAGDDDDDDDDYLWLSLVWRPAKSDIWGHRPRPAVAPSWSWASLGVPVYFPGLMLSDDERGAQRRHVTIHAYDCVPATADEFGRVAAGCLLVEGRLARRAAVPEAAPSPTDGAAISSESVGDATGVYYLLWSSWDGRAPPETQISYVLVLEREAPDGTGTGSDVFSRIDIDHYGGTGMEASLDNLFRDAPVQRFLLI